MQEETELNGKHVMDSALKLTERHTKKKKKETERNGKVRKEKILEGNGRKENWMKRNVTKIKEPGINRNHEKETEVHE